MAAKTDRSGSGHPRCGRQFARIARRYLGERHGAAAAEFAIVLLFLVVPLLNVIDLGLYIFERMLLDNAAQIAAQAAWSVCSTPATLPATPNSYANCPALPSALATAVHSTSLGSTISISSVTENYYCIVGANLVLVGTPPGAKPANCSGAGGLAADRPGDYVLITASYSYAPLFSGVSVASQLTTPITRTSWMRLS